MGGCVWVICKYYAIRDLSIQGIWYVQGMGDPGINPLWILREDCILLDLKNKNNNKTKQPYEVDTMVILSFTDIKTEAQRS